MQLADLFQADRDLLYLATARELVARAAAIASL